MYIVYKINSDFVAFIIKNIPKWKNGKGKMQRYKFNNQEKCISITIHAEKRKKKCTVQELVGETISHKKKRNTEALVVQTPKFPFISRLYSVYIYIPLSI